MKMFCWALLTVLLALQATGLTAARAQSAAKRIEIRTLSTRADRVSGGDVLIEIVATQPTQPTRPTRPTRPNVTLNGHDVSAAFHPGFGKVVGLVTSLIIGKNTLNVEGKAWAARDESLELTNYPITGPIISGPHQQPFVCQTETFKLPDGSTLGPATDAKCSAPTTVQYVYMPNGLKEFSPLINPHALPADVAT